MIRSTLTIIGLYEYDNSIFDYFDIPSGLNKDELITLIISEAGSFEVVYPSGPIMKNLVGVWSRKCLPIWEKLKESTELEYNPIWNYDRTEEEISDRTGNISGNSNITSGSTHTETSSVTYGRTDTDEQQVTGFNSETYVNNAKNTNTAGGSDSSTGSGGGTANETQSATANEKENQNRKLRAYGNIGVTTAPQMIREFREIEDYSVYDKICWDFINKFCVMVY